MSNLVVQGWDNNQLAVIKNQIARDCSDADLVLFSEVCKRTGLDPFTRQIYAISRNGRMTIQLSIDGFRAIAADSGQYNGSQTFWCGSDGVWVDCWLKDGNPVAAKTEIYRGNGDRPFVAVARFSEYVNEHPKDQIWRKLPALMIGKVSEALALRKAFPRQLSGLYSPEEMSQADISPTTNSLKDELVEALKNSGLDKKDWAVFIGDLGMGKSDSWGDAQYLTAIDAVSNVSVSKVYEQRSNDEMSEV